MKEYSLKARQMKNLRIYRSCLVEIRIVHFFCCDSTLRKTSASPHSLPNLAWKPLKGQSYKSASPLFGELQIFHNMTKNFPSTCWHFCRRDLRLQTGDVKSSCQIWGILLLTFIVSFLKALLWYLLWW